MALLGPIEGNGAILGNQVIWRPNTIVDDTIIIPGFNIEIGFYSPSGEYVGSVQTSPDGAGFINFEITENRIGGMDNFDFEIDRKVDIPFYPLLECRFYISGSLWYTGELIYQPSQDKRKITYQYSGNGYAEYLKRIKVLKTYQNTNLNEIINELIENYIAPETRIVYNQELINPPNISIIKYEIKNKDVYKILEELLEIANYNYKNIQFVFGVDKNRHFYFQPISNSIDIGLFEGFQYQEPDTKEDFKKVINQVNIYRTQDGTSTTEYVTTINDLDSQARYGIKAQNITISNFIDTNSAIKIANALIERKNIPLATVKVKNLETFDTPYSIQYYYLNNKPNNYQIIIAEFELLAEWNFYISNTIISASEEKVLSGLKAFKCININGSKNEYIEKTLDDEINLPIYLDVYLSQNVIGEFVKIYLWDDEENLLTKNLNVNITNDYIPVRVDITLINIKKIRLEFVSNSSVTIFFDRLEIITNAYYRRTLILDKITYKLDRSKLLADAQFGEKIDTIIDSIKKINDNTDNIFSVLEKG